MKYSKPNKQRKMTDSVWRRLEIGGYAIALQEGELREVITVKFAYPKDGAGRLHCALWYSYAGHTIHGYGCAGGYGYHKQSAAMADALRDMGFIDADDISGRGQTAMLDALRALLTFGGYGMGEDQRFVFIGG